MGVHRGQATHPGKHPVRCTFHRRRGYRPWVLLVSGVWMCRRRRSPVVCVALAPCGFGLVLSCGPGTLASSCRPGFSAFSKDPRTDPFAGITFMAELCGSGVMWPWYDLVVGLVFFRISCPFGLYLSSFRRSASRDGYRCVPEAVPNAAPSSNGGSTLRGYALQGMRKVAVPPGRRYSGCWCMWVSRSAAVSFPSSGKAVFVSVPPRFREEIVCW